MYVYDTDAYVGMATSSKVHKANGKSVVEFFLSFNFCCCMENNKAIN